jgi:hypothetical protein
LDQDLKLKVRDFLLEEGFFDEEEITTKEEAAKAVFENARSGRREIEAKIKQEGYPTALPSPLSMNFSPPRSTEDQASRRKLRRRQNRHRGGEGKNCGASCSRRFAPPPP